MSAKSQATFGELVLAGAREALAYKRGKRGGVRVTRRKTTSRHASVLPPSEFSRDEIRSLREGLGLSQTVFAQLIAVSPATVRAWEQGQREPSPASRRILSLVQRDPRIVAPDLVPCDASG